MKSGKKYVYILFIVFAGFLVLDCTTSVSRVRTRKRVDLSGRWNDTDSQMVAKEMISGMLDGRWIRQYRFSEGHKPVIIVGDIRNLTSEHIETGTFIKDIERELIESGKVRFVASNVERGQIRDEREDQQTFAERRTRADMFKETGADVFLIGTLKSHIDQEGRRQVRYYQVDLELIDIESNEKIWIGTKKIKKVVQKGVVSW